MGGYTHTPEIFPSFNVFDLLFSQQIILKGSLNHIL